MEYLDKRLKAGREAGKRGAQARYGQENGEHKYLATLWQERRGEERRRKERRRKERRQQQEKEKEKE